MISPSDNPNDQPEKQNAPARASVEQCIEQISAHIHRHVGKVATVFHELVSDELHIDVHIVEPKPEMPVYFAITSGMSCLAMNAPAGHPELRYAELVVSLPKDWPMDHDSWSDERNYWPIRWLKTLARYPHQFGRGIGLGHTLQNGDPPRPYAPSTRQCCALILSPLNCNNAFWRLNLSDDEVINFYSFVPIYKEEMQFARKSGGLALFDKLEAAGISDVIDPGRPNVCKKRFGIF